MLKDLKKQENEQFKRTESVQKKSNDKNIEEKINKDNSQHVKTPVNNTYIAGGNFVFFYTGIVKKESKAQRIKEAKARLLRNVADYKRLLFEESERQKFEKRVNELESNGRFRAGRTIRKFSRRQLENYQSSPYLPAPIIDYFVQDESKLSARQKEWRKNVVSKNDLIKETEPKYKPKNRLKLWQYVLWNHFSACKSTILYYLIPLILNIALLIYNFKNVSLFENVIVSAFAFAVFAGITLALKTGKNVITKFLGLIIIGIISFSVAVISFTMYPTLLSSLYAPFVIKLFLIYFGIYYFARVYVIFFISYGQDSEADFGNVVKVKSGAPGVGKTSQGVHEAHIMALLKWQKLQYDFWLWHSREKEILKRNDIKELLQYHEIKISYYFYANNPNCIPCLWSNIEITDLSGRKNHVIELGHIHGVDRLPLYSVVFFDEIGAVLKNEFSLKKGEFYDVSDMFRLGRQFLNWSVICCEQDPSNIYIDCRRVVGVNEYISGQSSECKPLLMKWIISLIHFSIKIKLDKKVKRRPIFAKITSWLDRFYDSLGFRKQVYSAGSNLLTGVKTSKKSEDNVKINVSAKNRVRYLPSNTGVIYNQDEYKKLYACYFDKEIKGKLAGSMSDIEYITSEGRTFVSETTLLNEKREAIDFDIKKLA